MFRVLFRVLVSISIGASSFASQAQTPPIAERPNEGPHPLIGGQALPRKNEKVGVGTNLSRVRDWFSEYSFVDAFKRSRSWFSGSPGRSGFQNRESLDIGPNGYPRSLKPGQVARTTMFWGKNVVYPEGDYVVLYEGRGKLEYSNAKTMESKKGRDVIQPDPKQGGFALAIAETDPADPVRDIRVLMPGGVCKADPFKWCKKSADCGNSECVPFERNYQTQIFHPLFLDLVKDFSTIRYTDWMDINEHDVRKGKWAERPLLTDPRWTEKGVPIEIIVELSNRISADAWLSIPHEADDDYVWKLAEYVRDNLNPKLKIYLEHSNEVWNGGFKQARDLRQLAQGKGLSQNPAEAVMLYHARRSVQIFKLFEKAFGGKDRLVRVLGSFIGVPMMSESMLKFEDNHKHADAIAIASYFGIGGDNPENSPVGSMTVDQIIKEMQGPAKEKLGGLIDRHAEIARKYKVKLVAYEGGDHLDTPRMFREDTRINELLDTVSRDPRMKDIYLDYLRMWKQKGGGLYTHFVSCAQPGFPGRFGAVEYLHQPKSQAPKWLALNAFMQESPRWW